MSKRKVVKKRNNGTWLETRNDKKKKATKKKRIERKKLKYKGKINEI